MRIIAVAISFLLTLACGVAFAQGPQNKDVFFLAGVAPGTSQRISGTAISVETDASLAIQGGFGYQVLSTTAGYVFLEIPIAFEFPGTSTASGLSFKNRLIANYIAPGIRFKFPISDRLSIYGLVGGGYGSFRRFEMDPTVADQVTARFRSGGIFDFGGGIDVRLRRGFSLRFETRDFVGGGDSTVGAGRHHLILMTGFALHF